MSSLIVFEVSTIVLMERIFEGRREGPGRALDLLPLGLEGEVLTAVLPEHAAAQLSLFGLCTPLTASLLKDNAY